MHQTRQFTKRRPQSPLINQQQSVDGLQVGGTKSRSGLAIQSNAPIHMTHRAVETELHDKVPSINPYTPVTQYKVQDEVHALHQHDPMENHHDHAYHDHGSHNVHDHNDHSAHNHGAHNHAVHNHNTHNHGAHNHGAHNHGVHDHSSLHQDHSSHNHSGHSHDHSGHNHDHHDHSGHSHDHSGHNHSHYPQVYTQPLPSYASIFESLLPSQKALFTCFIGHFMTGIIVWYLGAARESLAVVGFSYLVLFDSFGTLNNFVSSVLAVQPGFKTTSTKRPFGVKRFELVFALANMIFLLFGTMYTTKESLEHLLLENHHSGGHHEKSSIAFGLLFMLLVAIGASIGSCFKLKNHENLVKLMNSSKHSDYNDNPLDSLKRNMYSASIVMTGSTVFLLYLFNMTSSTLDKFVAFAESALMLYLGGPTAAALAKVLLQTMPDPIVSSVDQHIRMIQQNPNVVSVDKVHFWQNSYGKCIGTLEIIIRPEAQEDQVLETSFNILQNLVNENEGELTISVTKRE
ncbi:cation efflux family-domain-containing protein [Thamnidium elegans]|nr:cation efflux family-domain-containing protein [Thamnidium elegans]